jgi:release factor glutamine methyltransferase
MELGKDTNLKKAWKSAADHLRKVGIKTPLLDARLLLQEVLKITYEELLTQANRVLDEKEIENYEELIARRLKREPVSKILGYKEFWGMEFKTTEDTLDPRPESETIIESVLKNFKDRKSELKILDLGTGTGCLPLSLLKEYPSATAVGVDVSLEALKVATENAENLGFAKRIDFIKSDWLENVEGRFDVIISNPPYIKTEALDFLAAEVRLYDPRIALDGGRDGLNIYRKIIPRLVEHMSIRGKCFFEIGKWQENLVNDLLKDEGYEVLNVVKDLAGIPRTIIFQKPYLKIVK